MGTKPVLTLIGDIRHALDQIESKNHFIQSDDREMYIKRLEQENKKLKADFHTANRSKGQFQSMYLKKCVQLAEAKRDIDKLNFVDKREFGLGS